MIINKDSPLADFRNVLFLIWKYLGLPEPTKRQYEVADVLQNVVKGRLGLPVDPTFLDRYPLLKDDVTGAVIRRLIIQAFRGVGKSYITSALVCWCLAVDPHLNIMVVSASRDRADDFTSFTLRLIKEMPVFAFLIPAENQRSSMVKFDVAPAATSHSASVTSKGVMGQLAGSRADIIIPDDVEVPNTSETQGMRDKLSNRIREFDAILKPDGIVLFLGTPQCQDSTYTELESRGYTKIIWPARFPGAKWMTHNGYALAPCIAAEMEADPSITSGFGLDGRSGASTDPQRFTERDLEEREASYGSAGWALQFMLDTSLTDAERYPLKLADLLVMKLDPTVGPQRPVWTAMPEFVVDLPCVGFRGDRYHRPADFLGITDGDRPKLAEYEGCIMSIDPSGRGKDELAYAVVKQLNGFLFVFECRGLKGGYSPENLEILAKRAKHHGVTRILSESNFGDGMFDELLKPVLGRIYPCTIESVRHSKQKEKRIIDTLEPVMQTHRLVFDESVILGDLRAHADEAQELSLHRQLFHQMTRITYDRGALKHDDRLDALAIAVAFWTSSVAQDALRKVERRYEQEFDKRLRELRQGRVRGQYAPRPKKPNFMNKFMGK